MSIAFPTDIANHPDRDELIAEFAASEDGRFSVEAWNGKACHWSPDDHEVETIVATIADCSFVYLRLGTRGSFGPIAAFSWAMKHRACRLEILIDTDETNHSASPDRFVDFLAIYSHQLLKDQDQFDRILFPFPVTRLDGMFGLRADRNAANQLTLAEGKHRPWSSRHSG